MGRKVRPSPCCVVWTHGGLEPGGSRRGRLHSVDARSIRHWRWPPRISKGRGDAVNTHTSVTKKLAAVVVAAATSASLGLAAAPAGAAPMAHSALIAQAGKPIRIGPVTGLTASA